MDRLALLTGGPRGIGPVRLVLRIYFNFERKIS